MSLEDTLAEIVEGRLRVALAPLEQKVEKLTELVEKQTADLVPLEQIRGGNSKSAHEFLRRHPEVRALGVRVGRRLLFRRHEIEQLGREPLRSVGADK